TAYKRAGCDADTAHFGAAALDLFLALVPVEQLTPAVQGFAHEAAGDIGPFSANRRADFGLARGGVDLVNFHRIDAQLAGRLGQNRLHHHDALEAARLALRNARRGIRDHADAAHAHGRRLIHQRSDASGGHAIALRVIRSVVADRIHIHGGDAAVLGEAYL